LFQSVMNLFTKEYFPMSVLFFWLWFSNNDRPFLSSLAPVTYLLSLSMPCHRYKLKKLQDYEGVKSYLVYCVDWQDTWHNFCPRWAGTGNHCHDRFQVSICETKLYFSLIVVH
jgi:hypothetical protein